MKILLVGSGNRATAYAQYFANEIVYVCDINSEKPKKLIKKFGLKNAKPVSEYRNLKGFDTIIIATPDYTHLEVMDWAVKQNCPILLEKPVEVKTEKLIKLYEIAESYKYGIVLGFGLRYTFMYKKLLELLKTKPAGPIVSIEASETLGEIHAAKFFRRWHRNSNLSGGLLNTKCSHDMDILNLIAEALPEKVSSFGTNLLFKRKRGLKTCSELCPEYNDCIYVDTNEYIFSTADISICPFNIDSDIVDHQVVNILYKNGITATFTLTMHSHIGNRAIKIHCENGMIEASFDNQVIKLSVKGADRIDYTPADTTGNHGGGDRNLCNFFRDCYDKNNFPNQLHDGIAATAVALAADISRLNNSIVNFSELYNYINEKK